MVVGGREKRESFPVCYRGRKKFLCLPCVVRASGHKITTQIPNIPEFIPDCFLFLSIFLSFGERKNERKRATLLLGSIAAVLLATK